MSFCWNKQSVHIVSFLPGAHVHVLLGTWRHIIPSFQEHLPTWFSGRPVSAPPQLSAFSSAPRPPSGAPAACTTSPPPPSSWLAPSGARRWPGAGGGIPAHHDGFAPSPGPVVTKTSKRVYTLFIITLKTLFNIVEAPFIFFFYFEVCVVWWCSDGPINSQEYKSFDIYAVSINRYPWLNITTE